MWRDLWKEISQCLLLLNTNEANKPGNKNIGGFHSTITKPEKILGVTKGQKDLKLYWQTDKARWKQGLPNALRSMFRKKTSSIAHHHYQVWVCLLGGCDKLEQGSLWWQWASYSIPGNGSPHSGRKKCHSMGECFPKGQQRFWILGPATLEQGCSFCFAKFDLAQYLFWRSNPRAGAQ